MCSTIPKPGSQPATIDEIRLVTTLLNRATDRGITTAECYLSSEYSGRSSVTLRRPAGAMTADISRRRRYQRGGQGTLIRDREVDTKGET
jgi:hypothetical protein